MNIGPSQRSAPATVQYARSLVSSHPNDPRLKAIRWITPGSRVLEVGCGHGALTRVLHRDLGCSVVALDIDPSCASDVRDDAERFVCGDLSQSATLLTLPTNFDAIVMTDVLEHLPQPEHTLHALSRLLNPSGRLVITLPNVVVWHVRLPFMLGKFEYTDSGTLDRTHLRFFTPQSAKQLVTAAGLDLVAVDATWNIPILGRVLSYALLAEVDELEAKVRRRAPRHAEWLIAALRAQQRVNAAGWLAFLDRCGAVLRRTAPTLWTNHLVLCAQRPRSSSDKGQT